MEALNAMIDAWDADDDGRRIGSRARTVGEFFAVERPLLQPLPAEPFETGRGVYPAGGPVRPGHGAEQPLLGAGAADRPPVRVLLHASDLVIYDGRTEVARHERLPGKCGPAWTWTITWRRWSASPARCPARPRWSRPARPGSSPRSTTPGGPPPAGPTATPPAPGRWSRSCCCTAHMDGEHVVAGLAAALRAGALTADAVALEARKAADDADGQPAQTAARPRRRSRR